MLFYQLKFKSPDGAPFTKLDLKKSSAVHTTLKWPPHCPSSCRETRSSKSSEAVLFLIKVNSYILSRKSHAKKDNNNYGKQAHPASQNILQENPKNRRPSRSDIQRGYSRLPGYCTQSSGYSTRNPDLSNFTIKVFKTFPSSFTKSSIFLWNSIGTLIVTGTVLGPFGLPRCDSFFPVFFKSSFPRIYMSFIRNKNIYQLGTYCQIKIAECLQIPAEEACHVHN